VLAHELGHIKHRDTLLMTITATLAGAISMLANFGFYFGGGRNNNKGVGPIGGSPRRNPRKPRVPPHGASLLSRHEEYSFTFVDIRVLFRSLRHKLDPLDREILERAFQATLPAVQRNDSPVDFDSDEGLEAILRRELIEIACFNGVSDPETLRDILQARLPPVRQAPQTG